MYPGRNTVLFFGRAFVVSARLIAVSTLVLVTVLITVAGFALAVTCLSLVTVGVEAEVPVSFPVCPNPLITKITVKRKQNIDFTRDDYGAKIYG